MVHRLTEGNRIKTNVTSASCTKSAAACIICCMLRSTTSKPDLRKWKSCFHSNKCESVDAPALIKQRATRNTGVFGQESAFLMYFKLWWHSERHLKNIITQNMCYLIMSTIKEGEHASHPDIRLSIHFPPLLQSRLTVAVGSPELPFRSSWGSLRLSAFKQSPNGNNNNWPGTPYSLGWPGCKPSPNPQSTCRPE